MKPRLMLLLIVVLGSFVGLTAWRWMNGETRSAPRPDTANATTATPLPTSPGSAAGVAAPMTHAPPARRVGYVLSRRGAGLTTEGAETATPIAGGVLFPVLGEVGGGYEILDPCNRAGWLPADQVDPGLVPEERSGDFAGSVFVIDPGHGIPDYGAVGPTGLTETEVNLDVSQRVAALLRAPQDVDWATGTVTEGTEIPAAAAAVLTRNPDGPDGGQYQVGLSFRAAVANALEATALVSIHHNTAPEANLDHPGSEAFVSLTDPESPRLGGLLVEELRRSFSRFRADWMGSTGNGVTSRVNEEGEDYYSVLARSEVPAVIVEGVYISNPSEEALAKTDEFRRAYAEAVYRALVRFVTTDDYPIPAPGPTLWNIDRPGPSMSECRVPAP